LHQPSSVCVEIGQAHFGQEAQVAQIDAENGRAGCRKDARHGKQRAVAAQNDHQSGRVCRHLRALHHWAAEVYLAGLLVEQRLVAALAQPGDQLRQQPGELFLLRLADNRNTNHAVPVYPQHLRCQAGFTSVKQLKGT
jgi:hypothetical protein